MSDLFIQLGCAFIANAAFAILFQVSRKYLPLAGLIGCLGWISYYIAQPYMGAPMASFIATLVLTFLARLGAIKKECPVTMFLIPGIFPLVPGAGVFFTAYYLVSGQLEQAAGKGSESFLVSAAIVMGIVFILELPQNFFTLLAGKGRDSKKSSESMKKGI